MKVLYIPSGYTRIYQYLDQSILNAWRTNNLTVLTVKSPKNIVLIKKLINKYQPDLIMTLLGDHLPLSFLEWMKHLSIPTILWLTEDPYYIDRSLNVIPYFEYIFTIDTGALTFYKQKGIKQVYFLPLGTNPEIYYPHPKEEHLYFDICLAGFPYPDRINLVKLLVRETPYTINLVGPLWEKHIPTNPQTTFYKKWVPPKEIAKFFSNCKMVLNTSRPYNESSNQNSFLVENKSINNRTFDIACCDAFQITQEIDDLPHFFIENKEIISFNTQDEFLTKVTNCIHDGEVRRIMSYAAYIKVLKHHTFATRIAEILKIVQGK